MYCIYDEFDPDKSRKEWNIIFDTIIVHCLTSEEVIMISSMFLKFIKDKGPIEPEFINFYHNTVEIKVNGYNFIFTNYIEPCKISGFIWTVDRFIPKINMDRDFEDCFNELIFYNNED